MGSFGSVITMPGPLPQEALPHETTSGMPEAFPQEISSQDMIFDPFADSPPQPQTAAPMSPDFNEFTPQPVVEPVPRPTAKGLGLLPPPPTKESVKAANRMKTNSGIVTGVTSPTTTTPSSTTATSPPAPSDGKKIVHLEVNVIKIISVDCVKRGKTLKVKTQKLYIFEH